MNNTFLLKLKKTKEYAGHTAVRKSVRILQKEIALNHFFRLSTFCDNSDQYGIFVFPRTVGMVDEMIPLTKSNIDALPMKKLMTAANAAMLDLNSESSSVTDVRFSVEISQQQVPVTLMSSEFFMTYFHEQLVSAEEKEYGTSGNAIIRNNACINPPASAKTPDVTSKICIASSNTAKQSEFLYQARKLQPKSIICPQDSGALPKETARDEVTCKSGQNMLDGNDPFSEKGGKLNKKKKLAKMLLDSNAYIEHEHLMFNNKEHRGPGPHTYLDENGNENQARRRKCALAKDTGECISMKRGWCDKTGRTSMVCKHSTCGVNLHPACFQIWHFAKR